MVRIHKRISFCFFLTALILMVLLRYAFMVEIPRLLITGIILAVALIGDRDEVLAIIMCCIPLHEAVDFFTAIAICAVILVLKMLHSFKSFAPMILFGVMLIWELLHCLMIDCNWRLLIVSLIPLFFLTIVMCLDLSNIDYAFIVRSMAIVSASVCCVCLMSAIIEADYNFSLAIVNLQRLGIMADEDTLLGGKINPNALGIINILSITGLLQIRFASAHKKIDYWLIVILLIFGGLTVSRTFLICLLLMVFLMIIGYSDIQKKIKFILALCASFSVALFLFYWMFPSVYEYFISRFQTNDITTGRDILAKIYHEYITNNSNVLFFGVGLNDFANRLVNDYNVAFNVPHNSVQEIIVAWGMPGFTMFILLIVLIILEARKHNRQQNLINFIPIIILLIKSMAGQLLTSNYTILALVLSYLSLCQNFNLEKPLERFKLQRF